MTPKEFLLIKYPTNKYIDCPVPKQYWEDMREFSDANNKQLVEQNEELLEIVKNYDKDMNGLSAQNRLNEDGLKYHNHIKTAIRNAETK